MPPHCDSMDGPVVTAARRALALNAVEMVLPFVPKEAEADVVRLFARVGQARLASLISRQIADEHFFETVVRLHRAGEGAQFTGLKPAGLDVGPVIPLAERAIEARSSHELADFLSATLRAEIDRRFEGVMHLHGTPGGPVDEARARVSAMLGFQAWAHTLYRAMRADAHAAVAEHVTASSDAH